MKPWIILADPENSSALASDLEMANHANTFFTSIGVNLASKITVHNKDFILNLHTRVSNTNNTALSEFEEINQKELSVLVKKIDTSKSSNIPKINSHLFK